MNVMRPAAPSPARLRHALRRMALLALTTVAAVTTPTAIGAPNTPASDAVFRALEEELQRSMLLNLEELGRPYFVQYAVDDTQIERVVAAYGALTISGPSHTRTLHTQIRVGDMTLDNANFSGRGSFGRRGTEDLPIEDDVAALRQAIWQATDAQYKGAVETLTQKRAYLKDRAMPDRPADFTPAPAITSVATRVAIAFDRPHWEDYARKVSAAFARHPHILSSEIRIVAGVENKYLVNSEGARVLEPNREAVIRITAETQAEDGEHFSDELEYFARTAEGFPPLEKVLADIPKLAQRLEAIRRAPILEDYTGPVLMEKGAAPALFRQLLARGILGQPEPVGSARRSAQGSDNLENRLGKRVLPTSFRVYSDPLPDSFQGGPLAGHYRIDDEGLPARRVDVVTGGKLQGMLMSRTPTKKFKESNGHGRRGSSEWVRAGLANLFIECADPKPAAELRKALLQAADDEGLEFAIRIEGLQGRDAGDSFAARQRRASGGGGRSVGDPVRVFKVYVKDGREELVRGCEFRGLDERALRHILAAGDTPIADQRAISSGPSSAVIAPPVLLEEVELTRIERESERKPYLRSPLARNPTP